MPPLPLPPTAYRMTWQGTSFACAGLRRNCPLQYLDGLHVKVKASTKTREILQRSIFDTHNKLWS